MRHTHTHTLTTPEGIRLHAESGGDGPTMLLCNGLFCTTQYYVPWWEHFSKSYHLVQFDYRSHGASSDDPQPRRVTVEKLVDDAAVALENLCDHRTIVVGHSMGVRVAIELFTRYPDRIPCLVLLCGSAFDSLGTVASAWPIRKGVTGVIRLGAKVAPLTTMIKDVVVRRDYVTPVGTMLGGLNKDTPREPVEALLANVDRLDVTMMASLARSYIKQSVAHLLPRVSVPVLYMVGEKDHLASPRHGRDVVRRMPCAELHVVKGCTHLAPVEKPQEVCEVAERFLARVLPKVP